MNEPESAPVDSGRADLRLLCREVGDDTVVVSVAGELDMATVPQLGAYLRDTTASRPAHLVLDLSAVTFLAPPASAYSSQPATGKGAFTVSCT